jgi:hypothetical protein
LAVRGAAGCSDDSGWIYPNVDNEHAHVHNSAGQVMPTDSENSPGYSWTGLRQVSLGQ